MTPISAIGAFPDGRLRRCATNRTQPPWPLIPQGHLTEYDARAIKCSSPLSQAQDLHGTVDAVWMPGARPAHRSHRRRPHPGDVAKRASKARDARRLLLMSSGCMWHEAGEQMSRGRQWPTSCCARVRSSRQERRGQRDAVRHVSGHSSQVPGQVTPMDAPSSRPNSEKLVGQMSRDLEPPFNGCGDSRAEGVGKYSCMTPRTSTHGLIAGTGTRDCHGTPVSATG